MSSPAPRRSARTTASAAGSAASTPRRSARGSARGSQAPADDQASVASLSTPRNARMQRNAGPAGAAPQSSPLFYQSSPAVQAPSADEDGDEMEVEDGQQTPRASGRRGVNGELKSLFASGVDGSLLPCPAWECLFIYFVSSDLLQPQGCF